MCARCAETAQLVLQESGKEKAFMDTPSGGKRFPFCQRGLDVGQTITDDPST